MCSSRSRWRSENKRTVPVDFGLHAGRTRRFANQIDGGTQDGSQVLKNGTIFYHAHLGGRIESCCQINIRIRSGLAACHRSKQRKSGHAHRSKFGFVRLKAGNDYNAVHEAILAQMSQLINR